MIPFSQLDFGLQRRNDSMTMQRLAVGGFSLLCVLLLVLAGCKSSTSDAPAPSSPSGKEDDAVDVEVAKKKSINNLIQIGEAFHNHASAFADWLPYPGSMTGSKAVNPPPEAKVSWRVQILPFIEQANVYDQIRMNGWAVPDAVAKTAIAPYSNPLKKTPGAETHYRIFVGNGAAFEPGRRMMFPEIIDGTSNTILVVESADPVNWSNTDDLLFDPAKPLPKLGIFPGGFHALMFDGSIRWIPSDTPEATIKAMITRAGGEPALAGKRVDNLDPPKVAPGPAPSGFGFYGKLLSVKDGKIDVENHKGPFPLSPNVQVVIDGKDGKVEDLKIGEGIRVDCKIDKTVIKIVQTSKK
jgi:Protein of unknown function (DUF1559)